MFNLQTFTKLHTDVMEIQANVELARGLKPELLGRSEFNFCNEQLLKLIPKLYCHVWFNTMPILLLKQL